ncbi:MAG: 50S ribosomal protein L1 [Candidatus Kerfeldbacteria bacterium]|nr:50S ribosomal protein L1 [Candidatus Kerfeldbacteria bacterium]
MKRSKKYEAALKLVDQNKQYAPADAFALVPQTSATKFDAGVEVHIRLGIDPKKAEQMVRGSVVLPHGTGKKKRIAVFCEEKDQAAAKAAGADLVGGEELIKEIKTTNVIDFDIAVATPAIMKSMGPIAKILGPKGLMPNPRNETVTPKIAEAVKALSGGKITFRNDDTGNIHQLIGRVSFGSEKLLQNYEAFLDAIRRVKPNTVKGSYLQNITISSSMGPGIHVKA